MIKKFAEDDKLEQLGQQKRRVKEIEHKKEATHMIITTFVGRTALEGQVGAVSSRQAERSRRVPEAKGS